MAEMKIAIAEDNRQALDMLGNILESDKEIQVVGKAENGTDAYNMIVKTKPDIVFLDVVMPGMDGISVMERIKTNQDLSLIHILTGGRMVPAWLEVDAENLKGTVKELPSRDEIDVPVNEVLIVELYSK